MGIGAGGKHGFRVLPKDGCPQVSADWEESKRD
jgi:hypothetical protein